MGADTPADAQAVEVKPEEEPPPTPPIAKPAPRAVVLVVAVLDIIGILLTIAAAAVLTINEGANRRGWWAVGLASALAVPTTLFWVVSEDRRRRFMNAAQEAAERKSAKEAAARQAEKQQADQAAARQAEKQQADQEAAAKVADRRFVEALDGLIDHLQSIDGPLPEDLERWARKRRDEAEAREHFYFADRLTVVLTTKAQATGGTETTGGTQS